jgi:hypothetical protein
MGVTTELQQLQGEVPKPLIGVTGVAVNATEGVQGKISLSALQTRLI